VAPVETSYRLARTRVKMNAQRVNKLELPFYEELVNVRAKRYQLLLDMYADVQRSAALMHDSEYCAWARLLRPDEPCNCTSVHARRLSFDGCQLPPVVPLPYLRYAKCRFYTQVGESLFDADVGTPALYCFSATFCCLVTLFCECPR